MQSTGSPGDHGCGVCHFSHDIAILENKEVDEILTDS